MKLLLIFVIATLAVVTARGFCAGCQEPLDFQDAKHILNASLDKLAALDGPNYKSRQIHYATQQVVSGIKYTINADLIDVDNKVVTCNVVILKEAGLSKTEVTFRCPNQEDITKTYSN